MARVLGLLLSSITAIFDMETRTELVMLQKTMVVVEGVCRHLDPHLDIWKVSDPVVREWIERNLGPVGKIEDAGRGLSTLAGVAARAPEMALRAERLLTQLERDTENGLSLAPRSIERAGEAGAWRSRLLVGALWVIAIALVVGVMNGG